MRIFIFITLLCVSVFADLLGKVIKVTDGDTITILDKNRIQTHIRFFGIDAPEKTQAFGQRSKNSLSELVAGKDITVQVYGSDRYKRTIGIVYIDGRDINAEQVKRGFAWAYIHYSKKYTNDERLAREQRIGLWQDSNPTSPWDYRHKKE